MHLETQKKTKSLHSLTSVSRLNKYKSHAYAFAMFYQRYFPIIYCLKNTEIQFPMEKNCLLTEFGLRHVWSLLCPWITTSSFVRTLMYNASTRVSAMSFRTVGSTQNSYKARISLSGFRTFNIKTHANKKITSICKSSFATRKLLQILYSV